MSPEEITRLYQRIIAIEAKLTQLGTDLATLKATQNTHSLRMNTLEGKTTELKAGIDAVLAQIPKDNKQPLYRKYLRKPDIFFKIFWWK